MKNLNNETFFLVDDPNRYSLWPQGSYEDDRNLPWMCPGGRFLWFPSAPTVSSGSAAGSRTEIEEMIIIRYKNTLNKGFTQEKFALCFFLFSVIY